MVKTPKVYDFSVTQVEERLVSYLKGQRGASTVAEVMAGTGLPKYQVEQTLKVILDEYAGHLKVTESGELLYYFPSGMKSRTKGLGPSLRRAWRTFSRGAARVLAFLFKIWIVAMLVGYFLVFVALLLLAIVASFAVSAAARGDRQGGSRRSDGGFGAMFIVMRLADLAVRMWFYSSLLQGARGTRRPPGRPFYKSVFAFVFGEADPNADWEERQTTYVLSYIRSRKGVITIEELMALTGTEHDEAQILVNRFLLEFEGEPGVTENGTLIFQFPALLRLSAQEQGAVQAVSLQNPSAKKLITFSANKKRDNGWIIFFNAFNLLFGLYFLLMTMFPPAAAGAAKEGLSVLWYITGSLLAQSGINPIPIMGIALGLFPVAFSFFLFLIPLVRKFRQDSENEKIKSENLARRIYSAILEKPDSVDPAAFTPSRTEGTPKGWEAVRKRIIDRFAAMKAADPVKEPDGRFTYRFTELARELADLEEYRRKVDLSKFEVGKTVFDSGA